MHGSRKNIANDKAQTQSQFLQEELNCNTAFRVTKQDTESVLGEGA